jgi:hypothetical protein
MDGKSLLMKSDGVPAGTSVVKEISASYYYSDMKTAGGLLYIMSRDIWRSDGTPAGTYVIYSFPDNCGLEGS